MMESGSESTSAELTNLFASLVPGLIIGAYLAATTSLVVGALVAGLSLATVAITHRMSSRHKIYVYATLVLSSLILIVMTVR